MRTVANMSPDPGTIEADQPDKSPSTRPNRSQGRGRKQGICADPFVAKRPSASAATLGENPAPTATRTTASDFEKETGSQARLPAKLLTTRPASLPMRNRTRGGAGAGRGRRQGTDRESSDRREFRRVAGSSNSQDNGEPEEESVPDWRPQSRPAAGQRQRSRCCGPDDSA